MVERIKAINIFNVVVSKQKNYTQTTISAAVVVQSFTIY